MTDPIQETVEALNRVAQEQEKSPKRKEYERLRYDGEPADTQIISLIGSWDGALVLAGLPPAQQNQRTNYKKGNRYTLKDIFDAIQYVDDVVEGIPSVSQYKRKCRDDDPSYETIYYRFDDHDNIWETALQEAGIDLDQPSTGQTTYTDEECLDAILRVAEEQQSSPTQSEYKRLARDDEPSVSTIKSRFSGWTNAVAEAKATKPDLREKGIIA